MSKTPISLRIDSDLLTKVKARATDENRTLSNTIETLLQIALTIEKQSKS